MKDATNHLLLLNKFKNTESAQLCKNTDTGVELLARACKQTLGRVGGKNRQFVFRRKQKSGILINRSYCPVGNCAIRAVGYVYLALQDFAE